MQPPLRGWLVRNQPLQAAQLSLPPATATPARAAHPPAKGGEKCVLPTSVRPRPTASWPLDSEHDTIPGARAADRKARAAEIGKVFNELHPPKEGASASGNDVAESEDSE